MLYHGLGEDGTGKEIDLHHLLINRDIRFDKGGPTTHPAIVD